MIELKHTYDADPSLEYNEWLHLLNIELTQVGDCVNDVSIADVNLEVLYRRDHSYFDVANYIIANDFFVRGWDKELE